MAKDGKLNKRANKEHQKAKKIPREGPAFEVYFAPQPPPPDRPVLFFQHIRKTAGTSLRQVIHSNYGPTGTMGGRHVVNGAPPTYDPAVMRGWVADLLEAMSGDERDSIVCVAAHGANHLMHQIDRPTRAITILRDPLDRVMSRYHFSKSGRPYSLEELYGDADRILDDPDIRPRSQYFNGQSRSLMEPLFGVEIPELPCTQGPPDDASTYRERLFALLDERYLVGLQDRFEESVEFFGRQFGWKDVFVPHAKVNDRRPREMSDDTLSSEILAYNWLDQELYERYATQPLGAN